MRRLVFMLTVAGLSFGCGDRVDAGGADTTGGSSTGAGEESDDGSDGCPDPGCRKRGWSCSGPGENNGCCDGMECTPVGPDGTDWRCDGVSATGTEADCGGTPPGGTCEWVVLSGCEGHGVIADFCGEGRTLDKLRRCDGTCFVPNELYQAFSLCSCDTVMGAETCQDVECDCGGPSWDAVFCCTG